MILQQKLIDELITSKERANLLCDEERARHQKEIETERNQHHGILSQFMSIISTKPELGFENQRSKYYLRIRANYFECKKEKDIEEGLLSLLEE